MDKFSFLNAAHTGFIADLYDKYLLNPDAIEPSWRSFFQGYDLANENYSLKDDDSVEVPEEVRKEFLVVDLINGYRTRGHLFTKTNPVRERRQYQPNLDKTESYFVKEFVLWALVEYKQLSKYRYTEGIQFKDPYGSFISGL